MQRRKLIKPDFFRDFFEHTAQTFYRRFPLKNWRGRRLLAVDGTGLRLPNESWLGEALGWHENQHGQVPSVRWLITFDLLNLQPAKHANGLKAKIPTTNQPKTKV